MRNILLLIAFAAFGVFLFWANTRHQQQTSFSGSDKQGEEREQDGILLAQEQEFNMTYDPQLGYVPKSRLFAVTERLMQERRLHRAVSTDALSWTERGPNSDLPGPFGNSRGPGNNAVTAGRIRAVWADLTDATSHTVWIGS